MDMFDRLEDTVNRYEDITAELGNPDVVNDQNRFRKLMKEQSSLAPLIATYTEYKNCKQTIEDSLQLLDEESDEELKELAKEELNKDDVAFSLIGQYNHLSQNPYDKAFQKVRLELFANPTFAHYQVLLNEETNLILEINHRLSKLTKKGNYHENH